MAKEHSKPKIKVVLVDIPCHHCGKVFQSRYRTRPTPQFCSPRCNYHNRCGVGTDGLRHRICEQCGKTFSYDVTRGADKRLCSDFCRTQRRHANAKAKPLCVVEGCPNPRGYRSGVCNGCYCRIRRTGTLDRRTWHYRSLSSHGYVRLFKRDHPLSSANGSVYEHRQVLYDAIGEGPHSCHWCKAEVRWVNGAMQKDALVPDHLDGNKANNALSNLVPACNRCNATRGLFMGWVREHKDDPLLWQMYRDARTETA